MIKINIKTKIKIQEIKYKISNQFKNVLCFIFKPLMWIDDLNEKNYNHNEAKLKVKARKLTDEQAINIIAKEVYEKLIRNFVNKKGSTSIFFNLIFNSEFHNTIYDYTRTIQKNKLIRRWGYIQDIFDETRILKLTKMLEDELNANYAVITNYEKVYGQNSLVVRLDMEALK